MVAWGVDAGVHRWRDRTFRGPGHVGRGRVPVAVCLLDRPRSRHVPARWPARMKARVMAETDTWLTLGEAAAATGWKPERIRSLARRGTIQRKRGNSRDWLYHITPELVAARASTTADPSAGTDDAPLWQEVVELRVGLARAEERAAAAERLAVVEIAARDQLVTELRGALTREREVASGMKDQLGQLTTKFDEQLCAMRAELAAARRPWWRRMLSG